MQREERNKVSLRKRRGLIVGLIVRFSQLEWKKIVGVYGQTAVSAVTE